MGLNGDKTPGNMMLMQYIPNMTGHNQKTLKSCSQKFISL